MHLSNFVNKKKPNKFVQEMEAPETEINFEDLVLKNQESLKDEQVLDFSLEELTATNLEESDDKTEEGKKNEEVKTDDVAKTTEEPPKKEEPKKVELSNPDTEDFSSMAKKLLEKGDWEDALIEKDGSEVKLSEIDNLDEETFFAIWEEQKKISKENIDKNYIPVKGIDENKLKLINIIKNGGDIKEIFKDESQLQKPYEGVDIENPQNQQNILYNQYLRQGIEADDAKELVIKATKDLTLDAKAKHIVTGYQKLYEENLSKIEKETADLQKKELENIKEYKKSLSGFYKEEGIEDVLSKTLVDAATKIDKESGQLYIDTVYQSIMEDPAKAKDLIFFMLEQEKFLSKKGASIKRATDIKHLRNIKIVQDTSKQSNSIKEEDTNKNSGAFDNIVID